MLENICGGETLTVSGGAVKNNYLSAGECAVLQYTADSEDSPIIGNIDPLTGIAGNTVTITGRGFGSNVGSVNFGTTAAAIISWSDSCIKFTIPDVAAGYYSIAVPRLRAKVLAAMKNLRCLQFLAISDKSIVKKLAIFC